MTRLRPLFLTFLLLLLVAPTWARLGGGQSFSSGRSSSSSSSSSSRSYSSSSSSSSSWGSSSRSSSSSSSSGGSYSGGGGATGASTLFVMLGFVAIFILFSVLASGIEVQSKTVAYSPHHYEIPDASIRGHVSSVSQSPPWAQLKQHDPNFSEPVFKAFAHLLFARLQNARGKTDQGLSLYFEPKVVQFAEASGEVSNVVVGASRYLPEAQGSAGTDSLQMEFEATFTGANGDMYAVERWTFSRGKGILSKDPDIMLKLACPNCGHSGELSPQGVCPYCDRVVNTGLFSWRVSRRQIVDVVPKPPLGLEPGGQEAGTGSPTWFQTDFESQRRAFMARHPEFTPQDFTQRVKAIFLELQRAWSELDFDLARPFETDTLYDTHRFWIERYRAEGLRNQLTDIKITKIEACRFDHDAFYDIITVRIYASMKDWTVNQAGKVVSGSPHDDRRFSEYWTFLRRIGNKAGAVKVDISGCPNCGAPLRISQAGICEHCQSKITSGEFDWTLSSIEQDESYTGG